MPNFSYIKRLQARIKSIEDYGRLDVKTDILNNSFAYVKGRMYERWIDHIEALDASKNRTTGDIETDLIDCPPYLIESLLRDENFVERDLQITDIHSGILIDSTTTSATASKLNDSGGGFSGVVEIGDYAYNDTDDTSTTVTGIDSDTVLSVADDIFANAEDYRIVGAAGTIRINDLKSSEDDYYNYAIYYNATTDHKTYVTDYVGSTKTLVLASADTSASADDNIFLQNIQGDLKIDYASFDAIGNTTNGTRKDWVFARSFIR